MSEGRNLLDIAAELRKGSCPLDADELDLVARIGEGRRLRDIAVDLGESYDTTAGRVGAIRQRLGVRAAAHAALVCVYAGWLKPDELEAS